MRILNKLFATPLIFLCACNIDVGVPLDLSDLINTKDGARTIYGNLLIEIPACGDYEDSRNDSSLLIRAKSEVLSIFKEATYLDCFRQKFDSFARFKIPISIGMLKDNNYFSQDRINLMSDGRQLLAIGIPVPLRDRINLAREKSSFSAAFDIAISFQLKNDTTTPLSYMGVAVIVDGTPVVIGNYDLAPDAKSVVQISDVTAQQAMDKGRALVLLRE